MVWTIYCHVHVESGRRYVGLTKRTWQERWRAHLHSATSSRVQTYFAAAIRKYGKDAFSHEVLETCGTLEEANAAEERWIEDLDTRDPLKGFNLMKGGCHTPHPLKNPWARPEYREKQLRRPLDESIHSPKARANQVASMRTPESRSKRSSISMAVMSSPEVRAKVSAKARISNSDPNVRKRISDSLTGRTLSPEHIEKMSIISRGRKNSDLAREKTSSALLGRKLSEDHVKKIVERQTGRPLSTETKLRIGASHRGRKHSAEQRAAQSERQRGRVLSPEVYARITASCKATRERKMLAR